MCILHTWDTFLWFQGNLLCYLQPFFYCVRSILVDWDVRDPTALFVSHSEEWDLGGKTF